jgi:dsDNA-specific endonuclease/ATPase MutS2
LTNQFELLKLLNPNEIINRAFYIYESYSPNLCKIRKSKKQSDNNDIRQKYCEMEKEEEEKIRKNLTESIFSKVDDFYCNILYIASFDFIMAKARLAIKFGGICPKIEHSQKIIATKIRNPLIEKILQDKNAFFKQIDIELAIGSNILTGANMGGKSVLLNTLALNIILALSGFFVYAEAFMMPHLEYVFLLSQDLQSVKRGLSTFGAEVVELKNLIEDLQTKVGIAILDEFARGTNPEEGTTIINGLLSYIQKYKSFCLLSTHYSNIGTIEMQHFQVKGLKNADFEKMKFLIESNKSTSFDVIQDFMDYSIEKIPYNYKPNRDAIKIAVLLGLKEEVIIKTNT